jgi:hypothetical protein
MNSPIELMGVTLSEEGALVPQVAIVIPENQNLGLVPIQVTNSGSSRDGCRLSQNTQAVKRLA